MTASGSDGFSSPAGQTGTVNNAGVLQITNGTDSRVDTRVTLNNTGTFRVTGNGGSWNLEGGTVNNAGVIDIGAGAAIDINGGQLHLNAGTTVTGSGMILLDASIANNRLAVNADVTTTGGLKIVRGVFDGAGSIAVAGSLDLQMFSAASAVNTTVYANGGGNWTSGTVRIGTGSVNVNGGTVNWSGSTMRFTGSGFLTVGANATLDLKDSSSIAVDAGSPTVIVSGLFKKSGGTSNATIGGAVNLTVAAGGTLDVQAGTLTLEPLAVTNNGTIKAGTGAIAFNKATTVGGTGTLATDAAGTLTVGAGTNNTVTQSGGTFTNNGTLSLTAGTFRIASGVTMTNYTAGTTALTGGVWKVKDGTLNLDGRAISTIAAGTTVELAGNTAAVTGLSGLTQIAGHLRIYDGAIVTPLAPVSNGGTVEVSGTFGGAMTVTSTGILTGSGTVNGTVTVQSGGEIAPGPGPLVASGTRVLNTGALNLNGGGKYTWEINSWAADASAGSESNGFDQLRGINGVKLNLAGASAANRVVLKITSLNGSSAGQIANYDNAVARQWVIADFGNGNASGGVLNFSADKFTLDTSGFLNDLTGTAFTIGTSANGNQLILSFAPVPEPATVLLIGAAGLAVAGWRRKRRTTASRR